MASRNRKDWRNHEKRREQARGHGGGVDNYGFDGPQPHQQRFKPGQRSYNDNYGRRSARVPTTAGSGHYSDGSSVASYGFPPPPQQQQQVGPYPPPASLAGHPGKGKGFHPHGHPGFGPPESEEEEFNPIEKRRKCRDVVCLGIFAAAIVFMVVAACYAFAKGDLDRIRHGMSFDSDKCDNKTIFGSLVRFGPTAIDEADDVPSRMQNMYALKTLADPRQPRDVFDDAKTFYTEITEDFEHSWKEIIYMCLIALGVTIIMTVLLRLFAGVIIWVVVIGVSLAAIAGTIFLWVYWSERKKERNNGEDGAWSQTRVNGLLVGAVVASIVTALILLVFLFMRKRIKLVIRLFNEAGKAVHAMPLLLLQPLLTFLALVIALGLWFLVILFIESAGDPEFKTDDDGVFISCKIKKNWLITFARWWNLFMMYWMTQFIIGCQHLIIAGAVSTWFFTRKKSRLGFPILTSFQRLLRFHLGTIAFGSLIVAIVKLIRAVLNWISNRLGGTNAICKALMCCCQCFVWCLEKFLIFLNRNAYIEVAIYGYGFCKSARKAFKVIVNNALRVSAINSIGDFVLFLGKVTIVAATVVIGNEILKAKGGFNYIWAPLIVAGICAYLIAHCFISVYEMAIDTIFICFCEDCELNDGVTKPYFMSKGLMEFVKNSEKALKSKK